MSTLSHFSTHLKALRVHLSILGLVAILFLVVSEHAAPVSAQTIAPQHPTMGAPQMLGILSFTAKAKPDKVNVKWVTANEITIMGFHVWRRTAHGSSVRLDDTLIAALSPGELAGNSYVLKDTSVRKYKTYYYELEIVNADGTSSFTEEVMVKTK